MNRERDRRHLEYILEGVDLVLEWSSAGSERFLTDPLIQSAVLYRLETLAHSAGRLSVDLRQRHPDIPWRNITDFRNRLTHAYMELDLDLVWHGSRWSFPIFGWWSKPSCGI